MLGKPLELLDKLDKLVLTHSQYKLIKLSNNPSGKKAMLLSTSSLKKHLLIDGSLFY